MRSSKRKNTLSRSAFNFEHLMKLFACELWRISAEGQGAILVLPHIKTEYRGNDSATVLTLFWSP